MFTNENFNFFSLLPDVENWTAEGAQYSRAAICSLSDILDTPLTQLFQTAIMEHYRTCRLNYAACKQLIALLEEKGIAVTFDASVTPDLSFVPKVFSQLSAENEDIAAVFDQLLEDFWRIPTIEEIAAETHQPLDSLRNNSGIKKLSLEHQQVLNYIEWYFCSHSFDFPGNPITLASPSGYGAAEIDWRMYPYNLLLDVVPAVVRIMNRSQEEQELLSRLAHRLDCLVYFDLSAEERNAIISQCVKKEVHFCEPTLQWGFDFWGRNKRCDAIRTLKGMLQGEKLLVEKSLLGRKAVLAIPIEEMDLSIRAYNCLRRAGINTVDALISKTPDEMMRVRNLGRKCLEEVIDKVHQFGLRFVDEDLWVTKETSV